jgi:hypothetical protein
MDDADRTFAGLAPCLCSHDAYSVVVPTSVTFELAVVTSNGSRSSITAPIRLLSVARSSPQSLNSKLRCCVAAPVGVRWDGRCQLTPLDSHVARPIGQAEHIEGVRLEEFRAEVSEGVGRLPANPLWLNLADLIGSRVVRVHDEVARVARFVVEGDAEQRERELASADHDWRALSLEMMQQLPSARRHVISGLEHLGPTRDAERVVEIVGEVLRAQPHLLAEECPRILCAGCGHDTHERGVEGGMWKEGVEGGGWKEGVEGRGWEGWSGPGELWHWLSTWLQCSTVIRGHQRPSAAIGGHQRPSEAMKRRSEVLTCPQCSTSVF